MDFNPSAQWPKCLEFLGCTSRGEICKCRFQSQLMMVKNIEFEWILPILRPEKCIFGVYKLWKVCERLDLSSRFHGSKSQFWIDISNSPRNTVLACAEVVGSATTTDFNPWAQRWKKKKKNVEFEWKRSIATFICFCFTRRHSRSNMFCALILFSYVLEVSTSKQNQFLPKSLIDM